MGAVCDRSIVEGLPRRPVGATGLELTELGLGAACLGNLYQPMTDADALGTVRSALSAGINYIDSAPHYGFGLSEERIGASLISGDGVVVSTKVGRLLRPAPEVTDDAERFGFRSSAPFTPIFDYTYDGVMRSWTSSLGRLKRQNIDILYVHDIGRLTHGDAHAERFQQLTRGGGLRALQELRHEGHIRAFGIGVNEVEACLDVLDEADLDAILLAGRYTLLEQAPLDRMFPECKRRGTSVIIGGPYNSGILATGVSGYVSARFNYEAAPRDVAARVLRFERVCEEFGVRLPAAALQFALAHPQVVSVIPGLDSSSQVERTMALYSARIPAEFWGKLKSLGLIRDDAPVPAEARRE